MSARPAITPPVQAALWPSADAAAPPAVGPDLASYDRVICMVSGGKDSVACLLHLLEQGVDRERIELWHHCIDGQEGSHLMDWPVTHDYCRKLAAALGVPILFSWKEGGFERELLRERALTAPTLYEVPGGELVRIGGERGTPNTRRRFPQVSADLRVRWCSAVLKIDVADAALRNRRFRNGRTLVVTGERAEESASRANYRTFEQHRCDRRRGALRRHIDHWRPVHSWSAEQVWDIIRRHRVNPHPGYHLGFGRVSCLTCIFSSKNQLATVKRIAPQRLGAVATYEQSFGVTIKRSDSVLRLADLGTPYPAATPERARIALSPTFDEPIFVENWALPAGAFGECCGPS